jgi:hypothetical protein
MAMTQTEANKLTAAMNSAFEKIGNSNGTRMPKTDSNMDPIAYEFHVAAHLERIAKRRKENAEKACVKEGVLFDTEKSPRKPGTSEAIYTGDNVVIILSVNNPSDRLDSKQFIAELIDAGVDVMVINRAMEVSTKPTRAPHKFTSTLRTEG